MPIITAKIAEGRTSEQKKALIEQITLAVCESLGVKKESVTVIVEDMPKINYGVAGKRVLVEGEK